MNFDYGAFCKLVMPTLVVCLIASISINQFLVNDLNWHKQEVYDSLERQSFDRDFLRFNNEKLLRQINDLNLQLRVCEVVLIYEKEKVGE